LFFSNAATPFTHTTIYIKRAPQARAREGGGDQITLTRLRSLRTST
jgi:hypothetical protein